VGLVKEFVFDPKVIPGTKFMHRPTPLPPDKRAWLQDHMQA
jgi:hypothetical protein